MNAGAAGRPARLRVCRAVLALGLGWAVLSAQAQVDEPPAEPLHQRMADNFVRLMLAGWDKLTGKSSAGEASPPPPVAPEPVVAQTAPPPLAPAESRAQAKSDARKAARDALTNTLQVPNPPPTLPAATAAAPAAAEAPAPKAAPAPKTAKARKTDREAVLAEHGDDVTTQPIAGHAAARSDAEIGRGLSSWYGPGLHGRKTASGEPFDMNAMTAAHRTLPFGTKIRVRHMATGKEVVVRINDRGPHTKGRIIDLSRKAAEALGVTNGEHMVMLLPGG